MLVVSGSFARMHARTSSMPPAAAFSGSGSGSDAAELTRAEPATHAQAELRRGLEPWHLATMAGFKNSVVRGQPGCATQEHVPRPESIVYLEVQ